MFKHLAAQASTSEAYDTLTLPLNTSLQKFFSKFDELKDSMILAPILRAPNARGGEGPSKPWKPTLEFKLWDEDLDSDDEVKIVSGLLGNSSAEEDSDEDKYVTNGVLGLEASKKLFPKVLSKEEKRIWSVIS